MSNEKSFDIGYGLSDILVDGKDVGSQGDAAVLTIEPVMEPIDSYEFGGTVDYYLASWNVNLSVTFETENFEKLKMALPALQEIKSEIGDEVVGLTDGGLHQRLRDKASEIHVHPRHAGEDTDLDLTLFKAIPVGVYEKTMGREVVKYTVEFKALPLTSDSTKGGNYFRIGNEI